MPLILGMDFLVKASPSDDWKQKKVTCYVGPKSYILPTCSINDVDNVSDVNLFAGLSVDDETDRSEPEGSSDEAISKNSAHVATDKAC